MGTVYQPGPSRWKRPKFKREKLGLKSRAELVCYAAQQGWLQKG